MLNRFVFLTSIVLLFSAGNEKVVLAQNINLDTLQSKIAGSKNDSTKVNLICDLASAYIDSNDTRSFQLYKEAEQLSINIVWPIGIAKAYYGMGVVYRYKGFYDKGILYLLNSLRINESNRNKLGVADCYAGIAAIYNEMLEFDKAIFYCWKALSIYQEMGAEKSMIRGYTNLGVSYGWKHDTKNQVSCYTTALTLAEKYKDTAKISLCYMGLCDAGIIDKKFDEALKFGKKGLEMAKRTGIQNLITSNYLKIGQTYFMVDNCAVSMIYLNQALESANKTNVDIDKQAVHDMIYQVKYQMGDFKEAIDHLRVSNMYKDSLSGQNTRFYVADLEATYEKEKAHQQVDLLSSQNEVQSLKLKNLFFLLWGLLVLVAISISITVLILRHRKLKRIRNELDLQRKAMELEQKLFRAQINPHFLFNALNSIQKYIISGDSKNAHQYIGKFSDLIRSVLENSDQTYIPIKDELKTLQLYMEIERVRVNEKFDFSIQVDPELDVYNIDMPAMLLQPFVENSIWHGIMNLEGKGKIDVTVEKIPSAVRISIEDNGVGREKAREIARNNKPDHKSYGMKLIDDWITTLNSKDQSKRIELSIEDLYNRQRKAAGTRVIILLVNYSQ